MNLKNKKITIIYLISILLLIIILISSIPISNFLKKINLDDNQFVKDQIIINPNAKPDQIIERKVKIKFEARTDKSLNWQFYSLQDSVEINIGEVSIIKYEGKNISNETITATADFTVLPKKIIPYIIKTECFCFTEQTLKPGESQIFTMAFFLDPSIDTDDEFNNIKDLVFTYHISKYIS
tara:strand:- start:6253 stop:6795 length:543 start_codon:yes stop_codon:yes gene_type:complete